MTAPAPFDPQRDDPRHRHHLPRRDLLTAHPFQLGYVTTDVEEAMSRYAREFEAPDFSVTDRLIEGASGGSRCDVELRIAVGFLGELMVEFIQPLAGQTELYQDLLPAEGFGVALHHHGYVLDPGVVWADFRSRIDADEVALESEGDPSFLYLDTRAALGHYLEYLHFSAETYAKWIARVPVNS